MRIENLVILDLQNNLDIEKKNCSYINLSSGTIKFKNSKHIYLKNYQKKYYIFFKQLLINNLKKKINKKESNFLNECEIFNLRNDKELFINKMINILIIKKFIINKKIKKIKIVTDNYFTNKVFKKMNLDVEYFGLNRKKYDFSLLKILKFYIKTLFVVFLLKFQKKKILNDKYNNIYISLYPNFYKKNEEFFYKKKNGLKANFLLTDETHLGLNLKKIVNILINFKRKNTFHVESFINFIDIFKLIITLPINYLKNFNKIEKKLIILDCDFSEFFEHYFNRSMVNRFKLEVYNKSFKRIFCKFTKIKNFHYYMFEYSFGFYLTRLLKNKFNKLNLIGYQHGIFSNNIMWFDVIKLLDSNKNYFPNKIKALNKLCALDYKKQMKETPITYNKKQHKPQILADFIQRSYKNKLNNVLVLPGTHDVRDIYNLVLNSKIKNSKKNIYYFKLHPKSKFKLVENNFIKKINNIKKNFFSNVLISQTSTLVYSFLNLKKNFRIISCDYRPNLTSTRIGKKYEFIL